MLRLIGVDYQQSIFRFHSLTHTDKYIVSQIRTVACGLSMSHDVILFEDDIQLEALSGQRAHISLDCSYREAHDATDSYLTDSSPGEIQSLV